MNSVCHEDGSTFWLERQKTAIMSDSMSDFFFLSEKGEIHMALVGNQLTGECSITYPSHPGFVLYTVLVDGKKNGNCVLENEQGFIVLECSVHDNVVDGRVVRYTPQGVLLETGCLVNGKRDGSFFVFDEQRNIAEIHRFKNDEFVSVLHQCSSLKDYWEERSKATNEVTCVAKYTPDFSSMDGLCYMYEEGRVKRGELYSEGRMVRMMMEFDEKVRTEFGEGGEKCFVGEYKNDVESGFCKEGKGCVLKGGKVVEVNVYENGKKKRKWRVIRDNVMTEFDEKGNVMYVGGFAEFMEGFCPRNGRGKVYANKQLKCIGVFEMDELKMKEKEFEKGLMTEYKDGEKVYWGGYMKDKKGDYLRDGRGNLYKDGRVNCGCKYYNGKESLKMKWYSFSDKEMEVYSRRETKRHMGDDAPASINENGDHSEVSIDMETSKKGRYMADNRAIGFSLSFCVVSAVLALAMAVCASSHPAVVPYIMGATVVVEIAFMVFQHYTMFSDAAYYMNSITSMLVLLFAFCIAFYQVTNTVYFALSIVIGIEVIILAAMAIVDSKEKMTNYGAVFLIISLLLFIGCSAITIPSIKSPPMLSYVLLGLWIVSVILTNAFKSSGYFLFTHYAIPLVFTIMLVLVSIVFSKMNWFFFVTIAIIGIVFVFVSLGICINDNCEPILSYSLFAFDLGLFTWWCWLTLSSHSMSILSFFLLACFYGMSAGLCFCFTTVMNELADTILVIMVMCIMGCTCVFIAIDNTVLAVLFIVLNCILFSIVAFVYIAYDLKSLFAITQVACTLIVIEIVALVAWLWLFKRWMNTVKESPTAPPALLFMILSVIISLTPLIIGVAALAQSCFFAVLPVLLNAAVFGFCWYAVRYSSQFIPFVWFYGIVFGGFAMLVLTTCCCF